MNTAITMNSLNKPILLTGSHRSGSTWAGRMISTVNNVGYIFEPFNINLPITVNQQKFEMNFLHICNENEKNYKPAIDAVLNYNYPFWFNVKNNTDIKDIVRVCRDKSKSVIHNLLKRRPLVKDPIAFFSSEWLYKTYDMDIVIMIRHPAAFCSSLKYKDWHFDFNNFINQPLLMETYLKPFKDQIYEYNQNKPDIIDQAILLWNIFHHTIMLYQEKYPNWTYIRHEDLSASPTNEFKKIYKRLNLVFSDKSKLAINNSSGSHNPIEQQKNNEFVRDSKKNIKNWKNRLSRQEISKIRILTKKIADNFYDDSDW